MSALNVRRIQLGSRAAQVQLADLRAQLSAQGNVVSPRGRALTEKVFGEPLPPQRVVERVCEDVRCRGLPAVLHYTEQFDQVRLTADTLRVTPSEMALAHAAAKQDASAYGRAVAALASAASGLSAAYTQLRRLGYAIH